MLPEMDWIWQQSCPAHPRLGKLAQADSLTQALSALGRLTVSLEGLGESAGFPLFAGLGLPERMFCRRVVLHLDGVPVVRAQSVCGTDSVWRGILDCGQTPLGKILFSGSLQGLRRSRLEFARPKDCELARRSWFDYQGGRLYLAECFLPEILRFQAD